MSGGCSTSAGPTGVRVGTNGKASPVRVDEARDREGDQHPGPHQKVGPARRTHEKNRKASGLRVRSSLRTERCAVNQPPTQF